MPTQEGFLAVPGGRVWYRSVGEGGVPLLCLHGGPGFSHDYIEALADLSDRRRVIFYDQLGCGRADRPDDPRLWRAERFVEELVVVREALGLDELHLFGSSWGGMLALQYVLDHKAPLVSLVVANSPASMPRFARDNAALREQLPEEVRDVLNWHEAKGFTGCPEYQGAIAFWFKRHICRLTPWPEGLERAFAGLGVECYEAMVGPSEFHVVGNLKDWDVTERLSELTVPTLYVAGRHDEVRPEHMQAMHKQTPGSRFVVFENSAHLPFEEEREPFMTLVNAFLEASERPSSVVSGA